MGLAQWIVLAVAVQRLAELAFAASNTRRLRAAGAVEHGRRHYPLIVGLHAIWLVVLFVAIPATAAPVWPLLAAFVALQAARLWVIASLGRFWTTRVLTAPNTPLRRVGPYRFLRHPNYVIVVAELAILPLAFGQWLIAVLFTLVHLPLILHRIRVEDAALADRRGEDGSLGPYSQKDS
ncbi:MAG: isoprenylcysteine carboxyl methyltransferase family protein [Inquilinaceae bacterium]